MSNKQPVNISKIYYIFLAVFLFTNSIKCQEVFFDNGTTGFAIGYNHSKPDLSSKQNQKGLGILFVNKGKYAFGLNIDKALVRDFGNIDDDEDYLTLNSSTIYLSFLVYKDKQNRTLPLSALATIGYNSINRRDINSIIASTSLFKKFTSVGICFVPEINGTYSVSLSKSSDIRQFESAKERLVSESNFLFGISFGIGIPVFKNYIYITPSISFSGEQAVYGLSAGFALNLDESKKTK